MTEPTLRVDESSVSWREIDGEIVALDLAGGTYFSVNNSGVTIWQALASGSTRSALITLLADQYGLDEQRATKDVDAFVASCRDKGLLDET